MSKHGIRIKGGIGSNDGNEFYAIIHVWDNEEATGQPQEYAHPKTFNTESEAMTHYIKHIQPIVFEIAEKFNGKRNPIKAHEQLIKNDWVKT